MHVFYTPKLSGNFYILNEEESKHCARSLRLPIGETVQLIDGEGGYYLAKLAENSPKACILEILSNVQDYGKRNYWLHIAIAPTKNIDRFEWFLEKATEIGIDEITPIYCDHSERKQIKPERLEKILVSAAKQSINAFLPKLNEMTDFKKLVNQLDSAVTYIAHCADGTKTALSEIRNEQTTVLIGPEGDFSQKEIDLCREKGITEVSLGNSRLRTETAGIVACHTVCLVNNLSNISISSGKSGKY
ncbi:MAG: 16S rRNA (uracil(1498)-N(3))-methyltransferase [Bacteroidales bacterium]|nr:16S rRNA (uracil(1498)-N(3))-methyltransferase [Bacteroidales bacterium]